MAKNQYEKIEDWHQSFIEEQEMFFAATAAPEGRVNMAPKDSASLKIMNPNRVVWVNLTGAENETGAHLVKSPRMTLMWCSFGKRPMILRAYGTAEIMHPRDPAWSDLIDLFPCCLGSRQIIDLSVDMVLKSCGFGVPFYEFVGHRETLQRWEESKGEEGVHQHWVENNQVSIDGTSTYLLAEK